MHPTDVLAVVEDQFFEVRKRLDTQIARTAELQVQLDAQRRELAEVRRAVELANSLLQTLLARA